MSTLPKFEKDVTGEYSGNAYPEQAEYRVYIEQTGDGTKFQMWTEDSCGSVVGMYVFDDLIAEDGIIAMATTNHGLDGYEDDWHLPDGMYRTLQWLVPTLPFDVDIRLSEDDIDSIAGWLNYALGHAEYDGPEDAWEF